MNELSREHGFLVVYPEQSAKANGSKCWNWFNPEDQAREAGEPAFLAALTQELVRKYEVDPARVYVAGLSAGGAMAAILANTYPDLYKAVGVHSGLPYRAANSVASAFAAMGGRQSKSGNLRDTNLRPDLPVVPMIVFHGDADSTVAISNGKALIDQALAATRNSSPRPTVSGSTAGRDYSRTSYTTADGTPLAEYWVLHGAGHAWAGGDAAGSYADAGGPDASAEMVRFFMGAS
jgi:poly(hydroxyalkanoate) depolymerase family esterase